MRGLLASLAVLAAGCSTPTAPPTFDIAATRPTGNGDAATLTGWFTFSDRTFRLYPTRTKPADGAPCLSGILLSLAGVPTPDFNDRPMTVMGFIYDKADEAAQGAANPCQSSVIIEAIEVSIPEA